VVGSMVDQRALSITGTVWSGTGKLRENRTEGQARSAVPTLGCGLGLGVHLPGK
jgi:hypothetical protein